MTAVSVRARVLIAGAILSGALSGAEAKEYSVERIVIDASVRADGALEVSEAITYRFDGRFSEAYREIPTGASERVTDLRVFEEGTEYATSTRESPGSYAVERSSSATRVTWHYRARNERRTFRLSYRMQGAVRRHADVAELYYKFVGEDWDRPIGSVEVTVRVPSDAASSGLRAWAHGPLNGIVRLGTGSVSFRVAPLPARTFWEGRILFSPDAFARVPLAPGGLSRASILAEEAAWAEQANRRRDALGRELAEERVRAERRRELARSLLPWSIVLAVAGLASWFRLYRRHGRPHPVPSRMPPGEVPSDHPPAILSYLVHRNVGGTAIVATLLDLAERGYFTITETVFEKRKFFGGIARKRDYRFDCTEKPTADLEPFERELRDFLLAEAGGARTEGAGGRNAEGSDARDGRAGDGVVQVGGSPGFTMSGLKKTASRHRSRFVKWFRAWVRGVRDAGQAHGFYEPYPVSAMVANVLVGVGVLALGVAMSRATGSPVGVPAVIAGAVTALLTFTLTRRSREGRRLYVAWKAFERHLKSIARAMQPATLTSAEWARYVGAAIIFGMHEKLIPKLLLEGASGPGVHPAWYIGGSGDGSGVEGLSSLSDGFSSMVDAVTTTVSSASGTGGGASGGGGGGAGGGGGGAS